MTLSNISNIDVETYLDDCTERADCRCRLCRPTLRDELVFIPRSQRGCETPEQERLPRELWLIGFIYFLGGMFVAWRLFA